MSRRRFFVLLIAALAAICGALYLSTQRNLTRDTHGMALMPALANELNTVTALSVRKGSASATVTIHKQGEQWTVAERANYPADVPKLRKLLLALADARIREEKTSNPASYSIIGVEDPSQPGAAGAQIEVTAQDGKHAVIVGKPSAQGSFVRRAGENTSYLAEPAITFEAEPRYWIDTRLFDLPADKIQSIEFKPAAGPGYSVHIDSAAGAAKTTFTLSGVPGGRKALDSQQLAPSPTTFGGLTADDVAAAGDLDFSKPSIVALATTDGKVVTFTGTTLADKHWVQIAQPTDPALTAKTAGRAFEIPAYRYDAIFKPLEQLLVPKPASPVEEKRAAAGKAPANSKATAPKKSAPAPAS